MGKYGTVSVGRHNDRRWKLSPQAIVAIQRLHGVGRSMNSLAIRFGCAPLTVRYWVDNKYRDRQRAMNAQRRRSREEEVKQTANKQLRRDLVRHKVRAYTRKQMAAERARHLEKYRKLNREAARRRRLDPIKKAKELEAQKRYWHRHKCTCLKYGDHHINVPWPKGRKRSKGVSL